MKSLVIADKPSVARDIARVLHCSQKGNGTLEGKDYVVTWALGHLVTLADPEEYDKKYTKWELSTLPMMPEKMKLVVIRQTSKQYNAVKTQLLNQIWGYEFDGESRTVDVHIRTLRQKLGSAGDLVETVRGVGYKISGKCA